METNELEVLVTAEMWLLSINNFFFAVPSELDLFCCYVILQLTYLFIYLIIYLHAFLVLLHKEINLSEDPVS